MNTHRRTAEERQAQVEALLYRLQQNMDELMEIAKEAADMDRDKPRRTRVGKKR